MNPRIAYCTNVHAGETLAMTIAQLERHATAVRDSLGLTEPLGIGLWLSAAALGELATNDNARRLRDRLAELGLAVRTFNGFPYGNFHHERVKHDVYEPHWARPERYRYTRRLAELAPDLVPEGTSHVSISTLPLGWRQAFSNEGCGASVGLAAAQLTTLAGDLARIEATRGVRVTVDLEPEPGCLLDRSEHVIDLFDQCFRDATVRRHLGVCHDVCHAAVMFERQADVLAAYRKAGLGVHKVQVSAAVEADGSEASLEALATFVEPRYLHQTCVASREAVQLFEDLPLALAARPRGTWRTHFHVPIFQSSIGPLRATQAEILECLAALGGDTPTLEVETYAWSVLPSALQPASLAEGIAQELRWLAGRVP